MNKIACIDCVHFDPQFKYRHVMQSGSSTKKAVRVPIKGHGLCGAKSTYPATEQDGQVFPPDAKRVAEGELCVPVTVVPKGVIPHCLQAMAKPKAKAAR